jgi:hypothetical protein
VIVSELKQQDLQLAAKICGANAFKRFEESPQRGRSMLTRMLLEAPANSEEIEEIQAIRLCDGILHPPGS